MCLVDPAHIRAANAFNMSGQLAKRIVKTAGLYSQQYNTARKMVNNAMVKRLLDLLQDSKSANTKHTLPRDWLAIKKEAYSDAEVPIEVLQQLGLYISVRLNEPNCRQILLGTHLRDARKVFGLLLMDNAVLPSSKFCEPTSRPILATGLYARPLHLRVPLSWLSGVYDYASTIGALTKSLSFTPCRRGLRPAMVITSTKSCRLDLLMRRPHFKT